MRIDKLELHNFKKFESATFEFPRPLNALPDAGSVHVLIGENGSGKTSILNALAVSMGVWLVKTPDSTLANSRRPIQSSDRRREWREPVDSGDRRQFMEAPGGTAVTATGTIDNHPGLSWTFRVDEGRVRANNSGAKQALSLIEEAFRRARDGTQDLFPILAYYGAGRTWMPHRDRSESTRNHSRWGAFYDCLNERIRFADLIAWVRGEAIAKGNNKGRWRPGFDVVKRAVLRALPGADDLWFGSEPEEIVVSIRGNPQPLSDLSAGQRAIAALVMDIAIKMVIQNNHLVPAEDPSANESVPPVLALTPGIVLVDEIDVHLHPKWQRGVIETLRTLFPRIQFIATTHSPFIVQSLREGELIILDEKQPVSELGKLGVEAIAEGLMGVDQPEVGVRYASMVRTATDYLKTLELATDASKEQRIEIDKELENRIVPHADNPAFQAFLELKRAAALGPRQNGTPGSTDHSEGGD